MPFGRGQLGADQQRLDAADEEEEQRGGAVHDADLLVVDGGDPAAPAGRRPAGRVKTPSGRWRPARSPVGRARGRCRAFGDRHARLLYFEGRRGRRPAGRSASSVRPRLGMPRGSSPGSGTSGVHRLLGRRVAEPGLERGAVEASPPISSASTMPSPSPSSRSRSNMRAGEGAAAHEVGEVRGVAATTERLVCRCSASLELVVVDARRSGGSSSTALVKSCWPSSRGVVARSGIWPRPPAAASSHVVEVGLRSRATTLMRMLAWDRPQNSVHWPTYVAGLVGLERPGRGCGRARRRCLPLSAGIQNEWMTSRDVDVEARRRRRPG